MIISYKANNSGCIIHQEGVDIEHDSACKTVETWDWILFIKASQGIERNIWRQIGMISGGNGRCLIYFDCVHLTSRCCHLFVTDHLCHYWKRSVPIESARKFMWECSSWLFQVILRIVVLLSVSELMIIHYFISVKGK